MYNLNMGLLGAHVSIAGGIFKALERGENLGCDSIQVFTKNQRQWKAKPYSEKEIVSFKESFRKSTIKKVVAHSSYLINLGSPKKESLIKSREAFIDEIIRCHLLSIPMIVVHPGSHLGYGEKEGIRIIIDSINFIIGKTSHTDVKILLETVAGQGTNIGYRFEHIKEIMDGIENKQRVGVCFDTAHVFEAGYDIKYKESFQKVLEEFNNIIGIKNLFVFHINDSKTPLGSRVDRHTNIGDGEIGLEAFKFLVNNKLFSDLPMILETPGGEEAYVKDLRTLRGLIYK